jgi:hypothetical protein
MSFTLTKSDDFLYVAYATEIPLVAPDSRVIQTALSNSDNGESTVEKFLFIFFQAFATSQQLTRDQFLSHICTIIFMSHSSVFLPG